MKVLLIYIVLKKIYKKGEAYIYMDSLKCKHVKQMRKEMDFNCYIFISAFVNDH